MKIIASRKDKILKQRAEYDAQIDAIDKSINDSRKELNKAIHEAANSIETQISDAIGATSLSLEIHANQSIRSKGNEWEVDIRANDDRKFSHDAALSWNWSAYIDTDGNLVKDSGSWSGLKATTADQLADLEESVRVLKIINNIDWNSILSSNQISYYDYIDEDMLDKVRSLRSARPNFEGDLLTERLNELVDSDTAVELIKDSYFKGPVSMLVTKVSDKFLTGYIFPTRFLENRTPDEIRDYIGSTRRTSRDNLRLKDKLPVEQD